MIMSNTILFYLFFSVLSNAVYLFLYQSFAQQPFSDGKLRFPDPRFPGATSLVNNESPNESSQWAPSADHTEESLGKLKQKIPEVGFTAVGTDFITLEKVWVVGFPCWNSRDSVCLHQTLLSSKCGPHLEACWKCRFSGPTPGPQSQNLHRNKMPR